MSKEITIQNDSLHLDKDYMDFFSNIKIRLKTAQIRATLAANSELIKFYWELGKELNEKQRAQTWGTGFLEQPLRITGLS